LTPAERASRYRAAHADGAPRIKYRRPADRRAKALSGEGIEQYFSYHRINPLCV
jgi:hypothetical protein